MFLQKNFFFWLIIERVQVSGIRNLKNCSKYIFSKFSLFDKIKWSCFLKKKNSYRWVNFFFKFSISGISKAAEIFKFLQRADLTDFGKVSYSILKNCSKLFQNFYIGFSGYFQDIRKIKRDFVFSNSMIYWSYFFYKNFAYEEFEFFFNSASIGGYVTRFYFLFTIVMKVLISCTEIQIFYR
jgi:hypothetical protein